MCTRHQCNTKYDPITGRFGAIVSARTFDRHDQDQKEARWSAALRARDDALAAEETKIAAAVKANTIMERDTSLNEETARSELAGIKTTIGQISQVMERMKAIEADVLFIGLPTPKPPSYDVVCKALDKLLGLRGDAVELYRTLRPIFHGAYFKKQSIQALRAAVGVIYDDLKLLIDNRRKLWETENLRQVAERDTYVAGGGTLFDSGALSLEHKWFDVNNFCLFF